ncbi:hypothetical protein Emed_002939 [Eimeria media]
MTMGSLKFICLAGVSLASLVGADEANGADSSSITATGSRVKCLDELNHYRLAADFSAFTESKILAPKPKSGAPSGEETEADLDQDFLKYACDSLQSASSALSTDQAAFAVHSQSGANADCSAAVEYWKGAIVNFDSLPPEYQENTTPYTNPQNVSFVALFNPQANAAVDCAYVTCQKTTTPPSSKPNGGTDSGSTSTGGEGTATSPTTAAPSTTTTTTTSPTTVDTAGRDEDNVENHVQSQQDSELTESVNTRRLAAVNAGTGGTATQKTNLLVCVTKPAALKTGQKPFSEQEFQKITKALTSSASAAASASLSLFAASLAFLFL